MMQYELAPMEGITGYVYRSAYARYFGGIDRYFTPFIASTGLNHRERNDVLPEHNQAFLLGEESGQGTPTDGSDSQERGQRPRLVPQILTNRTEDFLVIADRLRQMGYTHVNLNLGCPSGTVVSRGRGAGFLRDPRQLELFLEEIYAKCPLSVSVKTRIGVTDAGQWEELLRVFARYPVEELIIHPRVQQDYYQHPIRWEGMELALAYWERMDCRIPLCYNGEIRTLADYQKLRQRFPQVERVMLGRGLLKNPFLIQQLRQWEAGMTEQEEQVPWEQRRELLQAFHQDLLTGYREIMAGDQNTLFKMKELWTYFGESFPGKEKALKRIRKAGSMAQYEAAVRAVFGQPMELPL